MSGRKLFLVAFAILTVSVGPSTARAQSGVRFSDMIGVNRAVEPARDGHDLLLGDVFKHNRNAYAWQSLEPSEGDFNIDLLNSINASFGDLYEDYGINTIPVLTYGTSWAGDTSTEEFDYQGDTYKRFVDMSRPEGERLQFRLTKPDGSTFTRSLPLNDLQLPPTEDHKDDWKEFGRQVVNGLGAPGNGGNRFYQVWNEPHPAQVYYRGSWEEFFSRIVEPAADTIRTQTPDRENAGIVDNRKVVFPGWIDQPNRGGPMGHEVPDLLEEYDAWDSFDVINAHYHSLKQLETMRQRMEQYGRGDMPLWMTEFSGTPIRRTAEGSIREADGTLFDADDTQDADGNDVFLGRDPGSLANFYPRYAQWANRHNDGDAERYRAYYFTYWSPDGINDQAVINASEGSGFEALVGGAGDNTFLTAHGKAVQTVSTLLSGGTLHNYDAVTTDTGLGFSVDERQSSIEGLTIESDQGKDRLVVAVHLTDADEDGAIEVLLSELSLADIASVERVTPWDEREAIQARVNPDGGGVLFDVTTDDLTGPNGQDWYDVSVLPRTFFLNLELNGPIPEPASLSLLALGAAGVLNRRPRSGP